MSDAILEDMPLSYFDHMPVLLNEVLSSISPTDGEIYVDATFGAGGYSRAILKAANCKVVAIDRDPDAYKRACEMSDEFDGRLIPVQGCFGDIQELLLSKNINAVDGIVADLGVSSMQIDTADRGFSFQSDGPLDMRMGQDGTTAADLVNELDEKELANIFFQLGDEKASRRIAKAIIERRIETPFVTTMDLANLILEVKGKNPKVRTHPATKSFQALRIHLNDELGEIDKILESSKSCLNENGRLLMVSFHSLEDRRVKRFLKNMALPAQRPSRHMPVLTKDVEEPKIFKMTQKNGLTATDEEIKHNPRSRSARLRFAIRTGYNIKNIED